MSLVGVAARAEWPDAIALRDDRVALTWVELDAILNRATNALLAMDLGPDRRVAVFAENSAETVIAYLATILAGASAVPVNHRLRAEELAYILQDSGAKLVLTGSESADKASEGARLAGGIPVVGWRCTLQAEVVDWDEFLERGDPGEPPTDLRSLPFLQYTSGTTGVPKGTDTPPQVQPAGTTIVEYIAHLSAGRHVAGAAVEYGEHRPQLLVTPLYHGLGLASVRGLAGGDPLVVLPRFDPERVLEAVQKYRVAAIRMVPTHFVRLLALPEDVRSRYDVSSLELIAHTAAPCPIEIKRRMIEWLGPILIEGYGATEMGSATRITSEEWLQKPGSVGRTLPEFDVLVIGDDGEELDANQTGRLYFRDRTGRGIVFHNDPVKTASVHLRPGIFTMGDRGYVDEDGYVYLTGRDADVVISGGVNIYPAEAENVLTSLKGVAEAICIGVPNDDLGEELKAFVVPSDPSDPPDPAVLIAECQARLSKYKCPRSVALVPDLGRNETGKIDRRLLRERFAQRVALER